MACSLVRTSVSCACSIQVSERRGDVRAEAAARHQFIGIGLDQDDVRRPPEDRRLDRAPVGEAAVDDLRCCVRPRGSRGGPGRGRPGRSRRRPSSASRRSSGRPASATPRVPNRGVSLVRPADAQKYRSDGSSSPCSPSTEPVSTRSRVSSPSLMIWRLSAWNASARFVGSLAKATGAAGPSFGPSLRGHQPGEAVEQRLLDAVALGEGLLVGQDRPGLKHREHDDPRERGGPRQPSESQQHGSSLGTGGPEDKPHRAGRQQDPSRALAAEGQPEIDPMKIGPWAQRTPRIPQQMSRQHLHRTDDEAKDPSAEGAPFVAGRPSAVPDPGDDQELERREPHRQVQPHPNRRADDVALIERAPGGFHLLVQLRGARHPHRDRQRIDRASRCADHQRDVDGTLAGLLPQAGEFLLDGADRPDLVRALRTAAGEDHGEPQRRSLRAGIMDHEVAQLVEIQPRETVRRRCPGRGKPGPHRRVAVAPTGIRNEGRPSPGGSRRAVGGVHRVPEPVEVSDIRADDQSVPRDPQAGERRDLDRSEARHRSFVEHPVPYEGDRVVRIGRAERAEGVRMRVGVSDATLRNGDAPAASATRGASAPDTESGSTRRTRPSPRTSRLRRSSAVRIGEDVRTTATLNDGDGSGVVRTEARYSQRTPPPSSRAFPSSAGLTMARSTAPVSSQCRRSAYVPRATENGSGIPASDRRPISARSTELSPSSAS